MKYLIAIVLTLSFFSCEDDISNRNPFLQEVPFSFELNLNLPLYNDLSNIGNPVYVGNTGVGLRGAFVMRTSFDSFFAFEASCPNHVPNDCSTMTIQGQNVICACEDFEYTLFTGEHLNRPDDGSRTFDLLFYRTRQSGSTVIISN